MGHFYSRRSCMLILWYGIGCWLVIDLFFVFTMLSNEFECLTLNLTPNEILKDCIVLKVMSFLSEAEKGLERLLQVSII